MGSVTRQASLRRRLQRRVGKPDGLAGADIEDLDVKIGRMAIQIDVLSEGRNRRARQGNGRVIRRANPKLRINEHGKPVPLSRSALRHAWSDPGERSEPVCKR